MNTYDTKPRRVSAVQMERLANWSLRKPVIALMGEFSAGKSTLLNLLLGENVLPTQVTATRMPPVWLRYGNEAPYRVDRNGMQHPVDMKDPSTFPLKETRFIRVHVMSPMLKNTDLMDTPGISDPNIPTDSWIRAIGYANAVLWCTHAGQAWRESERSAWEALPMRLRKTSLLLVTRADKIVNAVDLDKIDRRMQRETSQLFDGRHFISLTNAKKARDAADDAAWQASGAAGFMDSLTRIIEGVGIERSYLVSRYQVSDGASSESFVAAAREAQAAAIVVEAVVEEKVDFAESIARAAAEKDPPAVSTMRAAAIAAEMADAAEEEFSDAELDMAPEPEPEPAPTSMLRRVRHEGETTIERPSRSDFDNRFAHLNELAASAADSEPQDEPPTPIDSATIDALQDAFASVDVVEDVQDEDVEDEQAHSV
ncbi:MAG: dynamin family protein, partial [Deltaproteobacteria bacterium]